MSNKKVSIITPVYNSGKTIKKCLDSLCGQTYENIELIIIDDGSCDDSLTICEKYAEKDKRIRLIKQENSGPSKARNNGIDNATGDYVAFVDSDDYVEPNMFECMVTMAEESGAQMVVCGFCEEDGQNVREHRFSYRNGFYNEENFRTIAVDLIDNNTKTRIPPYSCIRLVDRMVLNKENLRFNPAIKRSEDYLFWTQVHFHINSMYLLGDEPLYHYVYNAASITRTYLKGYWQMCKELYEELARNLPKTSEVQKRLQAMLIQRSLVALHNAAMADKEQFEKDFREIVSDKLLIKFAWSVGLTKNSKRARIYAIMLILRLRFLIRKIFSHNGN